MSKRILIVGQHFWPESFRINDIADFLVDEKNCDVDVLCGLPNYPSGKLTDGYGYFKNRQQTHNGATIRRVFEIPRGNNSNFRIFVNYISFPLASLFHVPRLLTKKYDKIFIYQLSPVMMSIAGIIVGKFTRTETTMYVLDLWPENLYSVLDIKNPILRKIASSVSHWHYRHIDKLVALSETMKKRLLEVTNISPDRIIVLPQAAEKIHEAPIYDKVLHQRFKNKFTVVFTGNISPAQSFGTMIDAAEILKTQGYGDIHWVIVGDGMSRKDTEKIVKERDLSDIFSFEGYHPVEDIPKYTELADVLVGCLVKSRFLEATIPAKVMSYIASSRPIVIAMDGEARELISNTIGGGFAGPTGDASTLADNIKKVYEMSYEDRQELEARNKDYYFKNLERNFLLNKLYTFIFTKT
jgi:colanic acid biosynthesis glycosyl transferase WcaI